MSIKNIFGSNKEVGRNDQWIFYTNSLTRSASEWARDKWGLNNIGVLYVEERVYDELTEEIFNIPEDRQERAYLIVDTDDNTAIYENTSYESILYHIDFIGVSKRFDEHEKVH